MMKLLLDRIGPDVKITDKVVKAAAENWESGEVVMKILLNRRGVRSTTRAVVASVDPCSSST